MDFSKKTTALAERIHTYLETLCIAIPNRHVGSSGNKAAADFFAQIIAGFGFDIECPKFDCIDWEHGDVHLQAAGERFQAFVSPYSLSCHLTAPLIEAATLDQLGKRDAAGKILLIHGELAKEQLMPKNYPFYNPEAHQQIIAAFERLQPAAIIASTQKNPETAGALYPFPLIEDGNFNLPSVYMTDEEGTRLRRHCGANITLNFESRRIPSTGNNVIARKNAHAASRLVFCAHIDTKKNTPGAIDNATGVATLLALAELLADYSGDLGVEIVAMNGEDYYAASGELHYLASNAATLEQILLAVNLDAAGYYDGRTSFTLYECPDAIAKRVRKSLGNRQGLYEGDPWYQSDHMVFVQNKRPAIAITSEKLAELSSQITHTEKDAPHLVDCAKLVDIAGGLRELVREFSEHP